MKKLLFLVLIITACAKDSTTTTPKTNPYYTEVEQMARRYESGDSTGMVELMSTMENCSGQKECLDMAQAMYLLSNRYAINHNFPLAIELLHAGELAAIKSGNDEIGSSFFIDLAWSFLQLNKVDSVEFYLGVVNQVPEDQLSDLLKSKLFNIKATLARNQERYLESIDFYRRAYEIHQNTGSPDEAAITENIGVLYYSLKNYGRAIFYYKIAQPVYEAQSDTGRLIGLYTNLGVAYMRMDSLEKSAWFHLKCLDFAEENSFIKARSLANYGNVLRRQSRFDEAIKAFDSSISICQNLDIPFGVFLNKVNLAHTLMDLGKSREAIQLLNEIIDLPFIDNKEFEMEVWDILWQAYEKIGDIPNAFVYQKKYIDLRGELSKKADERIVLEWEENLVRQTKDKELAQLNVELNTSRLRQKFILALSIMILLLALSLGRLIYFRNQKEVLSTKLLEEEAENLRLQLEVKERELTSQSIHLQALGGFAEDISTKLNGLKGKLSNEHSEELSRIIRDFENGIPEELWEDFRVRFENVNKDFYQKLFQICPELTPVEIKVASFLRLNLSSKEISHLTNRSSGTITNIRSSLRKKLRLEEDDNLVAFLMSL